MYLTKLLLQILWQEPEIAAVVLWRPHFIGLDTDHKRGSLNSLIPYGCVMHTCFGASSPGLSPCHLWQIVSIAETGK